jgi:hypothetical protein
MDHPSTSPGPKPRPTRLSSTPKVVACGIPWNYYKKCSRPANFRSNGKCRVSGFSLTTNNELIQTRQLNQCSPLYNLQCCPEHHGGRVYCYVSSNFLHHSYEGSFSSATKLIVGNTIAHSTICEDNKGCVELANAPKLHPRTKHISLKYHHFHSHVATGSIKIQWIDTTHQLAWL